MWNHQLKYEPKARHEEVDTTDILFEPATSTLSIREILEKHSYGGVDAIVHDGVWSEDPSFDDYDLSEINNLDIVDRQEILAHVKDQVKEIQAQLNKDKKTEEQNLKAIEQAEKEFEAKDKPSSLSSPTESEGE